MTGRDVAWRGLAGFVLGVCAGALWLGGDGSLRVARTVDAWSAGQRSAPAYACAFRRQTGMPCPGCGGTEAFGLGARGHWRAAAVANPLGAFAALSAWALGLAAALTLLGAGSGWLRTVLALAAVLAPAAFVINGVVWWMSLPLGPR
jgi:hypothetical protein